MQLAVRLLILVLSIGAFVGLVHWRALAREAAALEENPPRGQIIEVDGVDVHVVTMGSGPDLILLHGAGGNINDFTFALAPRLAERYRVIVFDRPGLGWTGRIPGAHGKLWDTRAESPLEQAGFLQKAADQIGVKRPIVLGQSFGGAVAFAWALSDPDTAAVVSVAGVANPWPGQLSRLYRVNGSLAGGALVVPMLTAFAPQSLVEDTLASIFHPQPAPDGYLDHVGPGLSLRRETIRANARQVLSLRPHVVEMSERYHELDLPVEIVHGSADTIVPLNVHSITLPDQIEGANLTVLDGVGHMPHHTHMEDVIAAVDRAATRAGLR
ncbi:MAG: alpha/beta fold hydrolase [Pseudomonadota bacterium]